MAPYGTRGPQNLQHILPVRKDEFPNRHSLPPSTTLNGLPMAYGYISLGGSGGDTRHREHIMYMTLYI